MLELCLEEENPVSDRDCWFLHLFDLLEETGFEFLKEEEDDGGHLTTALRMLIKLFVKL